MAQGRVGQKAHGLPNAHFGHTDFIGSIEKIVGVLHRGHPGPMGGATVGEVEEASRPPGRLVGEAKGPQEALLLECPQNLQDILKGRDGLRGHMGVSQLAKTIGRPLGPMELVEVDVVALEPVGGIPPGPAVRWSGQKRPPPRM